MEQSKNKKNWWKYVLVFLGGAAVTAIVVMATTGSLFTGSMLGVNAPSTSSDLQVAPVDVNQLKSQVNELRTQLQSLATTVQDLNTEVTTLTNTTVKNLSDWTSSRTAKFDGLIYFVKYHWDEYYNGVRYIYVENKSDTPDLTVLGLAKVTRLNNTSFYTTQEQSALAGGGRR